MAKEAIDLTLSDSDEDTESPTAAAAREAAQRQSIMSFARAKRARIETASSDTPPSSTSAPSAAAAGLTGFGNEDLRALHEARMQRQRANQAAAGQASSPDRSNLQQQGGRSGAAAAAAVGPSSSNAAALSAIVQDMIGGGGSSQKVVSLLTYNVWFREDVAVRQRMQGIADIIMSSGYPTFVCFQEVTPRIMSMFAMMPWWQRYICSPAPVDAPYFTLLLVNKAAAPGVSSSSFEEVHFDNSCMGRSLRVATVTIGGRKVLVATSHLESPIPPHQWYSRERQQQMRFSLAQLEKAPYGNILFAGDMNWTDSRDGAPPLPACWCDVWQQLHPEDPGFTYDSQNNPMLPYKNPGLRLDRIYAKMSDFRLGSISIVGREQLGAATYIHTLKNGGSKQLPVLPSDHFGLLLKVEER